jgi:hypothetical protein
MKRTERKIINNKYESRENNGRGDTTLAPHASAGASVVYFASLCGEK